MKKYIKNKKIMSKLAGAILLVVITAIVISYGNSIERGGLRPTGGSQFVSGVIEEVLDSSIEESEDGELYGNQKVMVRITSGEYRGEEYEASCPYSNRSGAKAEEGLKVVVLLSGGQDGDMVASIYNYNRSPVLWVLIIGFLGIICMIGGKKGVMSSIGLVFTFVCIFFLYLPLMYTGMSPFLAATLTTILITVVVMILIGGISYKTLCAILGTIAGVLISGGLAGIFGAASHISGLNMEDVETLIYVAQNSELQVGGVLFSGILIASLGAVMDVAMSVSSTISEIHENSPELGWKRLFRSGINVGKDMMGTMSNTLILAFAGSSVHTLIIIYGYDMSYLEFMNRYDIAIELLRGICGSMGVVLTVPFVSLISALTMSKCKTESNYEGTE